MNDFSKTKIGDKLWSPLFGWGEVCKICLTDKPYIVLKAKNNDFYTFNCKGIYYGVVNNEEYPQSLFFEEMTLIPKSKEGAPVTFDPNKPYQRRDGQACKIIHTTKDGKFVVVALQSDAVYYCFADGHYLQSMEHAFDLINIPEKIEGWVNIYNDIVHKNKALADNTPRANSRVGCIYVSFTKGEGTKNE